MMGVFHLQIYRRSICQFDPNDVVIQRGDDKVKRSKSWHAFLLRCPSYRISRPVYESASTPPALLMPTGFYRSSLLKITAP